MDANDAGRPLWRTASRSSCPQWRGPDYGDMAARVGGASATRPITMKFNNRRSRSGI
jgi:hypothetical protein